LTQGNLLVKIRIKLILTNKNMLQSRLFSKAEKDISSEETSKNAQLLTRAGFVYKEMAGVYTFLPLGLRVIEKIKDIIREELNKIGGQEIKMTALQKKDSWEKSGRWDESVVDDWFRTKLKNGTELGLAFTHEEPLTVIMRKFISSYRDLPQYPYQFQTKFRNELRAKSGVMRGREFLMKDLYDFSLNKKQHDEFYEKMKGVYMNIFKKCGIGDQTYLTMSSGGSFSKYSFEFQTISEAGEDVIIYDEDKKIAINKDDYSDELLKDFKLNKEELNFKEARSIEIGDIYTLGEKYSKAIGLTYKNEKGEDKNVFMGSYGIGVPRLMGAIVEVLHDDKGIVWPENVAPFKVHIVSLSKSEEDQSYQKSKALYDDLVSKNIEVLWDDRLNKGPGEKFAESDLIGIPYRVVVSDRTLAESKYEIKKRNEGESCMTKKDELIDMLKGY
jgi:prolyl-tRNA synthetase